MANKGLRIRQSKPSQENMSDSPEMGENRGTGSWVPLIARCGMIGGSMRWASMFSVNLCVLQTRAGPGDSL